MNALSYALLEAKIFVKKRSLQFRRRVMGKAEYFQAARSYTLTLIKDSGISTLILCQPKFARFKNGQERMAGCVFATAELEVRKQLLRSLTSFRIMDVARTTSRWE